MQWSSGSSNKEWYVYDASGKRVLRRSQTSSGTTVTVYAFGLEEHTYTFDGSGNPTGQTQTYYYSLGGSLLGALEVNGSTSTTNYFLTDALGSVLATINNTANSASVVGNQLYDPYGNNRYQSGNLTTSKGFTGQYNDNLTGLDYYGSRYYDPAAGVFLSADPIAGDLAGANPYEYVNANPETNTDPTGGMVACGAGCGGGSPMPPPPLAGGGSAAGGGGTSSSSYPLSSCGQPGQSACIWAQYAAQSNWQTTVQVKVNLHLLNEGGVLCHAGGTSLAVGLPLDGFSTLTMTSSPGGCYSSGGGGNTQVTGTATVYGASTTSLDGCASISCFDDGGGAAEKPSDGEAVGDSTGAAELAALMDDEGGDGGNGGKGGDVNGQSGPRVNPQDVRFTQSTVSNRGNGYTVQGNIQALLDGSLSPEDLPPIKVFTKTEEMDAWGSIKTKFGVADPKNLENGILYTLDNRRLYAFQQAGITDIPVEFVDNKLSSIYRDRFKFTTSNYGIPAILRL